MSITHGLSGYVRRCRCGICYTAHRIYHQTRRQARYDAGQCRHCAQTREATSVLCLSCLEEARDYQQRYRLRKARAFWQRREQETSAA